MATAAVVGLGTMGPGIAATLSRAGMKVTAFDVSPDQRAKAAQGLKTATTVLTNLGVADRSNGAEVRIAETLEDCVRGADLVVETVPEKLDIKAKVLQEIDKAVERSCIIASNTSGIPISKLQSGNSAPGRVVGMHWSNPPHIIPMIEVIAGNETAAETVTWMVDTIKGLGLLPVVVQKDVPGFVENRILYALLRECVDLVEKGVIDAEGLDTCVSWGIGYKLSVIGPMALLDMAGLDIYQAVGSYLNKELCNRGDVSGYVTERTAGGKLGMKTKGGIFNYTPERIAELQGQRARKLVGVRKALES
jgi:5-formyl-3-hydroxy-2-methylpyridine 4-carboxylate dehydrogenase